METQEALPIDVDAEVVAKSPAKKTAKKTAKKKTAKKGIPNLLVKIDAKLITSNLTEYVAYIKKNIASLKYELVTDADFAEAKSNAKSLREAEKSIKDQKDSILKKAKALYTELSLMDEVSEECRQAALSMEKQLKKRDVERKAEIVQFAYDSANIKDKSCLRGVLQNQIKGMSSYESMETKLETCVEEININSSECRAILDAFIETNGRALVHDYNELEQGTPATIEKDLEQRLALAKAEAEAKRVKAENDALRKRAEEEELRIEAKAKAEARRRDEQAEREQQAIDDYDENSGAQDVKPREQEAFFPPQGTTMPTAEAPVNYDMPITEEQEKQSVIDCFTQCMIPLKHKLAHLIHDNNKAKAAKLRASVIEAFTLFVS